MENLRHRPRVSRETRLLLATVCVAAVALWVLARVRSLEPSTSVLTGPAPSLLAPLVGASHDQLSADLARLDARIGPWIATVPVDSASGDSASSVPAVRLRDDLVVAALPAGTAVRPGAGSTVVARDRLTGLTLVRQSGSPAVPAPGLWQGGPPPTARYLMAAESSLAGTALRPFVARGIVVRPARGWREPVWTLPAATGVAAGSVVFTTGAELVGVVVEDRGTAALVPAAVLLAEVESLLARADRPDGTLPIEVDALAPGVAALLGVTSGVVVAWVDPSALARLALEPGDVVQQVNGQAVRTIDDWLVQAERLTSDQEVRVSVVRGGQSREVRVMAVAAVPPGPPAVPAEPGSARATAELGLDMRNVAGRGIVVERVAPGSRGADAGLRPGDVITLAGDTDVPTAAQLRRAFARGPVLVTVDRGARHHVLALRP